MFNTLSTNDFYTEVNSLSLEDFLLWFKGRLEVNWICLTDAEVERIERKWDVHFPAPCRKLLTVLGYEKNDGSTSSIFYNWIDDQEHIAKSLAWPLEGLLFDVKNSMWGKNWGKRPDSMHDREKRLTELVGEAPSLIPINGHRYMLDYPINSQNPILSIYQSDIIVYGMDLQRYLLNEFAYMLNLNGDRAYKNALKGWRKDLIAAIPFWGDIILGNYDWDDELG